jgi:SAM-dependent methyltransferase
VESWSELNDRRREVRERWPSIWRLPVIPRAARHAAARVRPGDRVLDVGASDGRFGRKLPEGVCYEALDVDPRVPADHRSLSSVESASMDVVTCFETIEHLSLDEAFDLLRGIARVLRPGAVLFLSTPNVHHPWSYLRSATHRTPFCYDELGGLLVLAGLSVERLFRCHNESLLKRLLRPLALPFHFALGVDYAKGILAEARRPSESTRPEN